MYQLDLLSQKFLSAYCVLSTVTGAGDTIMNKPYVIPHSQLMVKVEIGLTTLENWFI